MANWLYIDFNSFFASCEQQENPALRGKPIAVVPMMADTTFCLAASYEAKAFGVKTGIRVGDAKKKCPGLVLVQAHHSIYLRYHHRAIELVDRVLPVHRVCSIDEICCELTGSQKQLSSAKDLAQKIKAVFANELGVALTASIGLGPNPLLAKMAADMQKPNGLSWIETQELPEKLFSLKLNDVPGIGKKMEARLHAKGIFTMQQLLALQSGQMHSVWNSVVGGHFHRLLAGENFSPWREGEQKSIGHEHVLPPALRTFQKAKSILQRLLGKAAIRLRKGGWSCRRMTISIHYVDGKKWKEHTSFNETDNTSSLLSFLLQLYQRSSPSGKPFKVAVTLWDFVSSANQQLSLFENPKRTKTFQIVDAINEKFGANTLYVASLHDHLDSAPTRISFQRIPERDEF